MVIKMMKVMMVYSMVKIVMMMKWGRVMMIVIRMIPMRKMIVVMVMTMMTMTVVGWMDRWSLAEYKITLLYSALLYTVHLCLATNMSDKMVNPKKIV